MLQLYTYELIRNGNEERRAKSLERYRLLHAEPETGFATPRAEREADVVELVFGAHCDVEESIGA